MFKLLQIILILFLTSLNKAELQFGDECILENGAQGTCVDYDMCPKAKEKWIQSHFCGFRKSRASIVCCQNFVKRSRSEEFCFKYGEQLYDQQVYSIVGGEGVRPAEFPHMAALGFGNKQNIKWNCGGSLISERFVLTAAHCLNNSELGLVKFVRLGEIEVNRPFVEVNFVERINKMVTANTPTLLQDFEVKRRIRHPEYKPPAKYHDIGLIELNKPAVFSAYVKPACLHTKPTFPKVDIFYSDQATDPENREARNLTATGWGLTQFAGNPSVYLQKVTLQPFDHSQCARSYRTLSKRVLPNGILEDRQVCAGSHEEKDTCQGDSGGPLQYYKLDQLLWGIVGTTAFGKTCGVPGVPSVYTRVSYYVPWIENIVWPEKKEPKMIGDIVWPD